MAGERGEVVVMGVVAGEDLSAAQYKVIAMDGTVANNNTEALGSQTTKAQLGDAVSCDVSGRMVCVSGAALAKSIAVKVVTSGFIAAVASGDGSCGTTFEAVNSGDQVSILGNFANAVTDFQ